MKLKELMKSDAQCISPEQPTQAAARMMREANVGFLPVCDDSGKVLGTITDRDITLRVVADGKSPSTKVEQVMTREIVAGRPETGSMKWLSIGLLSFRLTARSRRGW